jgi:hypothetical protein
MVGAASGERLLPEVTGANSRLPCGRGRANEKGQNGNGRLLEKVGMDLGLAPLPLGFGATSIWGRRSVGLGGAAKALPP